jgi:hypothetical protein
MKTPSPRQKFLKVKGETEMRQKHLKQISGVGLAILLILTFMQFLVTAQEPQDVQSRQLQAEQKSQDEQESIGSREFAKHARKIEGVWESQVTVRVCQTGTPIITFRGMTMFIRGGSLIATNATPPTTGGPAFGKWQYLGGRRYIAAFRFFQFNPDGSLAGVRRVTRDITLGQGGDDFIATISFQTFDANDNLIGTGCSTETAKRVE